MNSCICFDFDEHLSDFRKTSQKLENICMSPLSEIYFKFAKCSDNFAGTKYIVHMRRHFVRWVAPDFIIMNVGSTHPMLVPDQSL